MIDNQEDRAIASHRSGALRAEPQGSRAKPPAAIAGRLAKCTYCSSTTADPDAAFREYRGEGSRWATETCHCGYYLTAHDKPHVLRACANKGVGQGPRGPAEFDNFYCGCRGWD